MQFLLLPESLQLHLLSFFDGNQVPRLQRCSKSFNRLVRSNRRRLRKIQLTCSIIVEHKTSQIALLPQEDFDFTTNQRIVFTFEPLECRCCTGGPGQRLDTDIQFAYVPEESSVQLCEDVEATQIVLKHGRDVRWRSERMRAMKKRWMNCGGLGWNPSNLKRIRIWNVDCQERPTIDGICALLEFLVERVTFKHATFNMDAEEGAVKALRRIRGVPGFTIEEQLTEEELIDAFKEQYVQTLNLLFYRQQIGRNFFTSEPGQRLTRLEVDFSQVSLADEDFSPSRGLRVLSLMCCTVSQEAVRKFLLEWHRGEREIERFVVKVRAVAGQDFVRFLTSGMNCDTESHSFRICRQQGEILGVQTLMLSEDGLLRRFVAELKHE